ncbi:MAG: radical SAM protein [Rhodospirillum sp.]|nr:radical SAM protein [Rhodospirillum sp.]
MTTKAPSEGRLFRILLIKPSHYDEDGYVIQWRKAFMPIHVLAVVRGILDDITARGALPAGVRLETRGLDESSTVIDRAALLRWLGKADRGLVMMVGVQSNQVPRAIDIGETFTKAGSPVAMGGFHVSGCMAMVPDWEPAFSGLRAAGFTLYAGEFEEHAAAFLRDAWEGTLKPLYNHLDASTVMATAPLPDVASNLETNTLRPVAGLDVGRGCPFVCSFCTVINVHGRKMRQRNIPSLRNHLLALRDQGVKELLIVDDNFARNPSWREMFDLFVELRDTQGVAFELLIQTDTQAHRIPGFVEMAARAGCLRVYIGVETLNVSNLGDAGKPQNRNLDRVKEGVIAWKRAGVLSICSYIVGFPGDTRDSVRADMAYLKRELPFDLFYVYILTPLPGSEDHKKAVAAGLPMDHDLNNYDAQHVVLQHPIMNKEEWVALYHDMVDWFYEPDHLETLFKRAMAHGVSIKDVVMFSAAVYATYKVHKLHPLEGGAFRRRIRTDRRPGLPQEPALPFHARELARGFLNATHYLGIYARFGWIYLRARRAFRATGGYSDAALTLPSHPSREDVRQSA